MESTANANALPTPKSELSRLKSERKTFQLKFADAQRQLIDAQRVILEERIEKERLECELGDARAELALSERKMEAAGEVELGAGVVDVGRRDRDREDELAKVKRLLKEGEAEIASLRKELEEVKGRRKNKARRSLRDSVCQTDTPPTYADAEQHSNNTQAAATLDVATGTAIASTNTKRKTRIVQYIGLPPYRPRYRHRSIKSSIKPELKPEPSIPRTQARTQMTRPSRAISISTSVSASSPPGNPLKRKAEQVAVPVESEEAQRKADVLKKLKFSRKNSISTPDTSSAPAHPPPPPSALPFLPPPPTTETETTLQTYVNNLHSSLPSGSNRPRPLTSLVEIRRDLLSSSYGMAGQQMLVRICAERNPIPSSSSTGSHTTPWERRVLLPSLDRNPFLPQGPCQPGALFTARGEDQLNLERCSLFVKRPSKSKPVWEYTGDYKVYWTGKIEGRWYTKLTAKVRLSVEQDIMKKAKHAHYRESIAGKLGKPIGRLAIEDVRDALVSGEEKINIFCLEPIGYDEFFANDMLRRIKESQRRVGDDGDDDDDDAVQVLVGDRGREGGKAKGKSENEGESAGDARTSGHASSTSKPNSLSIVDSGYGSYGSEMEVEAEIQVLVGAEGEGEGEMDMDIDEDAEEEVEADTTEDNRSSPRVSFTPGDHLNFDSDGELTELSEDEDE